MLAAAGGSLSKSGGKCDLPISRCRYHVIHPPALPGCISDRCHPCQGVGSVHIRSRPDTHRYLRQFINRSFCFTTRSEEHTSELQSLRHLVCRLLLEKKKK